jgi:hypothetical protein
MRRCAISADKPTDDWVEVSHVVAVLERMGLPYAVGGSMASSFHGFPRSTHDADIMVAPFPGREEEFAQQFARHYYVSLPAIRSANQLRRSFNVINTQTGFKIDFFVEKERPFDRMAIRRRTGAYQIGEKSIDIVAAEDSVLLKLEWYRLGGETSDRQWTDVLHVLEVQRETIDIDYLKHWATELRVSDLLAKALAQAGIESTNEA